MSNSISLSMFLRDYFVREWSSGVVQTFLSHVNILNWLWTGPIFPFVYDKEDLS